jgi:uncharacterized protein YuzE
MRLTYDHKADALYIGLRRVPAAESLEIEDGVIVDVDDEGHIIGVEVLDASHRLSPKELCEVSYENLNSKERAALKLP